MSSRHSFLNTIPALVFVSLLFMPCFAIAATVTVTKTVSPAQTVLNGPMSYTITLTNTGSGTANMTTLVDTLAGGFSYVAGSTSGFTTNNPAIAGQTLTWSGHWQIGSGGTGTLTFGAKAGGSYGTFYNNVTVGGNNFANASTGNTAAVVVATEPLITLGKSVDMASAPPGSVLTYTIYYHNTGATPAYNLIILDNIPPNTTYVAGSLRMGNAASTYATATAKTDAADADEAELSGGSLIFRPSTVSPDDGVANGGNDEGKVYLQLRIN